MEYNIENKQGGNTYPRKMKFVRNKKNQGILDQQEPSGILNQQEPQSKSEVEVICICHSKHGK